MTFGAAGLPGLICNLVVGAVGTELGREVGDVVTALPSVPTQMPGVRLPGGRMREHIEREREQLAQLTATRLPGPEPRPRSTSGGQAAEPGLIESPGGRALANLISNIGTRNPQDSREAALRIERALEQAAAREGRSDLLASVAAHTQSTAGDEQVLEVVLPASGHFPEGGRFVIRASEVLLLLSRTRPLAGSRRN